MAERQAQATIVLEVSGLHWATEKNVAEAVLSRRPGVLAVDANPVSQTATVTYDPSRTSVAELAGWVRDCAGQSVPDHPLAEPASAPTNRNITTRMLIRPRRS
jgi:P-type Cu2+ transporter